MTTNNNLSVLPWYTSIQQQNARKWWVYNRVYPLYAKAYRIPPFQLIVPHTSFPTISSITLYDANTNTAIRNITQSMRTYGDLTIKSLYGGSDVVVYPSTYELDDYGGEMRNGRYYLVAVINGTTYYSEVFTIVNDIEPYLKITWWDTQDFRMDAGTIVYTNPTYKNFLYLPSDIAKPDYQFEEEGETRDGFFFPTKQISKKQYRFNFIASEYLLDVMRFIRMADYAVIEYHGQTYNLDSFLITPEWEDNGDVAVVEAVFESATVAKKIGLGYVRSE